jgi:hypothetical protein
MVFNATFNNSSAISWGSLLLVEETSIEYTLLWTGFELTTLVVIATDYTGSSESKLYLKDILLKIVTAVIRSQPITEIFTWESCDILWFVLICFKCLESAAPAYGVLVYISQLIRYFPRTYCY